MKKYLKKIKTKSLFVLIVSGNVTTYMDDKSNDLIN